MLKGSPKGKKRFCRKCQPRIPSILQSTQRSFAAGGERGKKERKGSHLRGGIEKPLCLQGLMEKIFPHDRRSEARHAQRKKTSLTFLGRVRRERPVLMPERRRKEVLRNYLFKKQECS